MTKNTASVVNFSNIQRAASDDDIILPKSYKAMQKIEKSLEKQFDT
jgi:hypothetical protein